MWSTLFTWVQLHTYPLMSASVDHVLASSEIRSCSSNQEKVVALRYTFKFSMRQIAATLEMSKSTVQRVLKGYQEGHFPGKPGRPRLLQDKEEHELVEFVKKNWKSKQGVSRNDVKEEVL